MISFQKVSKTYKNDITALNDIGFKIEKGEFVFIVGPSGAGKSTIIRLIIRNELPTKGNILFDDVDVIKLHKSLLPAYRQQIGVVFQDYKLLENKTIKENIQFALELTGNEDKEIEETSEYLLDLVKLSNRSNLFPVQLSGGEKQKVSIARAIANDPKILIADEPTGNLDPVTSEEIIDLLQKINTWGTTVIIATHDEKTVDALQKRVIRLESGSIVRDQKGGYNSQPARTSTISTQIEEQKISKLKLPQKVLKTLQKNNIKAIKDLLDQSEVDLEKIKGLSKKNIKTILRKIEHLLQKK